ncbi:alpha-glucosidase [Paenibacillus dendritiformis]|uniref:Alpha amylase catalytic subunit n=1 Tax=Paenibacillus dendritiformis C454 TaxID=1131935 RepID=H3SMF6_9BACL|nr:alpha-glucosidase [Paenibacillus dendritiformis]EHQ59747.1 alpha amylase catalytic subunit [Paenibacillus dendritiformis C454]CAH8768484.1 alpha-glucosidase [Paenibacillus dendritiformis]
MEAPWWTSAVFYEIYMPSFCDGNGDGIGDFAGIASKLDELAKLGVNGLWLTPFYLSPKVDNGYDIADYTAIDPDYGTMEDFDAFIREAHARDIRVIVDLVLNHTSSEHPWFRESRSTRSHPKRDWYIWRDPVNGGPPNNWESFFGGPAWEFDEATGQYYYHAFAKEQVDLNWTHPEVRAAMKGVMDFWLDRGIDGFRLDVINFLKVSGTFPDNPYDAETGEQQHVHDKDQEGILDAIAELSAHAHARQGTFMVGEVGSEDMDVLRRYSGTGLLDVVFNFNLGSQETFSLERLYDELRRMEEAHAPDQLPTLFFSSHDMRRHITRFGEGNPGLEEGRAKLIAALTLTAKGVPFLYYGEEIGMRDFVAETIEEMRDVQGLTAYRLALAEGLRPEEALEKALAKSRDNSRTPMQWTDETYGGFSDAAPWIGMGPRHEVLNVRTQQRVPDSIYSFYRQLIALRSRHPSLHSGDYARLDRQGNVLFYVKRAAGEVALVALNFGMEPYALPVGSLLAGTFRFVLSNHGEPSGANESFILRSQEAAIWISENSSVKETCHT